MNYVEALEVALSLIDARCTDIERTLGTLKLESSIRNYDQMLEHFHDAYGTLDALREEIARPVEARP